MKGTGQSVICFVFDLPSFCGYSSRCTEASQKFNRIGGYIAFFWPDLRMQPTIFLNIGTRLSKLATVHTLL